MAHQGVSPLGNSGQKSLRRRRSAPPERRGVDEAPARPASAASYQPARRRRSRPLDNPAPRRAEAMPLGARRALGGRNWIGGALVEAITGLLCWAGLASLLYAADPRNPLAQAAFFLLLFGAVFFILAPVVRGLSRQFAQSRIFQDALERHATRQALMVATFVVLNALLQLERAWSGLTALLLLGTFAVIEVVALARQ